MSEKKQRSNWASRSTFILAAVGSAVGLGNAWRFPGLCAKYGGGAFLLVYLITMLILGIPLLMMEIAIGRKMKKGAPEALRGMNKKFEPIGWAATSNAFVIEIYYSVVFAWVILMSFASLKYFPSMTGNSEAASGLFYSLIQLDDTFSNYSIPPLVLICVLIAWGLIYYCIRNGVHSVGKVVKYTVLLPIIFLLILAVKGLTMAGAMDGIKALFIPDFSALGNSALWIDAIGQVFYSLSIMMAIMIAYGSYLGDDQNIATDAVIIAFSDMAISVLAGVVMFTTMYGVGKTTGDMSASGIGTAFVIYPTAIVNLTNSGIVNGIFGVVFYLCLVTLAIDSAFSIVEGVSTAVSDKFKLKNKKTTLTICIISAVLSLIFATRCGLVWLDIVDNWANMYNLVFIGILEAIAIGWFFKPQKVLDEINKNANKFKMPKWWFISTLKYIAPILLSVMFIWNLVTLFTKQNGVYGGYPLWTNIAGGWIITALVFASGFIVKAIVKAKKKKGFVEEEPVWKDN